MSDVFVLKPLFVRPWAHVLFASLLAFAAQPGAHAGGRATLRVKLEVVVDRDKDLITSYLARRLRSLPDVLVVSQDPSFSIHCMALRGQSQSGRYAGYCISTVLTGFEEARSIARTYAPMLPASDQSAFRERLSGVEVCLYQNLDTCPPEALQRTCEEIIDLLDGKYFEPLRVKSASDNE